MSDELAAAGATTPDSPAPAPTEVVQSLLTAPAPDSTTQPDGGAPEAQTEQDAPAAPEVPEKYEFAMPEGVQLDEKAVAEFEPLARELKLDNPTAQKFVDLYAKVQASQAQAQQEAWAKQVNGWVQDVKTDAEMGGQNFNASIQAAQAAISRYGSPALREALDRNGLGNHPELVRVFARIGKEMAEAPLRTGATVAAQLTPEQVLYPSMRQNP